MLRALFLLLATTLPEFAQPVLIPSAAIAGHSGKCLDVDAGSTANGAAIIQFVCLSGANQQFTLKPAGQAFQVVARHSGKCLNVVLGSTASNALVEQTTCANSNSQLWTTQPINTGYQLKALHSGLCMAVRSGSTADLAPIVQLACANSTSQEWRFPAAAAPSTFTVQHSGKCAGIENASTLDGVRALQYACSNTTNQQFTIRADSGYFRLAAAHSDKCLSVQSASLADGADVVQLGCASQDHQLWSLRQAGAYYQMVAKHSGKCLNVAGASTADGARLIQAPCGSATNELWAIAPGSASSSGPGVWSSAISLPLVPVAVANLPNGRLLLWSAYDRFNFGGDRGRTYTAIFDPANNTSTQRLVRSTDHDMFCPGTANLADGRILVNGGSSSTKTSIYNPFNDTWQTAQTMNTGRGYQGDTVLSNGEVFTIGGSWSGGLGGKDGEAWNAANGWRRLTGAPATVMTGPDPAGVYRGDNQPWLFGTANGEVFHAGPSANMNWFGTAGTGTNRSAGNRGDDSYAMNGNAVMFDVGKIFKVGGAPAYENANASRSAYVIDINSGVQVTRVANANFARAFHNSVVLPTGEVVVVGGQSYPVPFTDSTAVLNAELFNPNTGTFTTLAAMSVPRTYHSTAILLPNGRIFVGGGGLCGSCSVNHADAQIFTPPYLLNPDGTARTRPSINSAPAQTTWGGTADVTTNTAVTGFVLMRLSSVTHTVSNDQRRVPLAFTTIGTNTYRLTVPSNRGVVLPGYYMLFALNSAGTPSVARSILIQ